MLSDADPLAVGSVADPGTGLLASREDHVHVGVHSIRELGEAELYGDVTLSSGLAISMSQVLQDIQIAVVPSGLFTDLDPRYANIADAETITGLWTFDRDPAAPFAVSAGSAVVPNLDADLLDGKEYSDLVDEFVNVTGDSMTGALIIGEGGELADAVALQLGDPTHEGGDIIAYKNDVGGIGFEVDADSGFVGIGRAPSYPLHIRCQASVLTGIFLTKEPYEGIGYNRGIWLNVINAFGYSAYGNTTQGISMEVVQHRFLDDAVEEVMDTHGIQALVYDDGDFYPLTKDSCRRIYGFIFTGAYSGWARTGYDNTAEIYGAYLRGRNLVKVNKASGTITGKSYGVYAYGETVPAITTGVFVGETYGGYFLAEGTNEGTQTIYGAHALGYATGAPPTATVYGLYARAYGGLVNWAGYFVDADVYVEQNLEVHVAVKTDVMSEVTLNAGVSIDGVLCKDGVIPNSAYPNALLLDGSRNSTGLQSFTAGIKTDTIAEVTLNANVTMLNHLDMYDGTTIHRILFKTTSIREDPWGNISIRNRADTSYANIVFQNAEFGTQRPIGGGNAYFRTVSDGTYIYFEPWLGSSGHLAAKIGAGLFEIMRAGDITGLAGKVFTWNGTVGADLDMNLNFLLKMPLKHICHFTMSQGVTDIIIETIPAGEFAQDMHISKLIAALDQAPGAGKSVTVVITDGTNTMTVTISNTDTTGSTTTGAFDWDASATSLTLKYSQTAGGSATKATVVCVHHYIATA